VTEHPEDEQERDEQELEAAQEHVADEPAAEQPGAAEPNTEETPEAPAAAAPPDEAPAPEAAAAPPEEAPAPEAAAAPPEEAPAPEAAAAPPEEAPAAQAPAEQAPAESAEEASALEEDEELEEPAPRQRPEIPGADLVPDIVPEGEEFLDAEARAAAEAEAEAAAARERDQEPEEEARPIADAAIDLAAGARYTATGKRKTAVARVILKPGAGTYLINGKQLDQFFPRETLQRIIRQPLETVGYESRMDVVARMHGGGVAAQAGALRHGISRALLVADPNLRSELKRRGFLTRDPRVKERKKAGLKKARKRPQFSKR
jgi:small subunit ribosomal protein S9